MSAETMISEPSCFVVVFQSFPGGSAVKNLPVNTADASSILGPEDSLEKEMATHSGILAWRIPWTEEPGGLQSWGSRRVRHDLVANTTATTHLSI